MLRWPIRLKLMVGLSLVVGMMLILMGGSTFGLHSFHMSNLTLTDQLCEIGLTRAYALTDIESDLDRCRADAGRLVESVSEQMARDWLPAR